MLGLKNGMVLQRGNDNCCMIFIESDNPISEACYTTGEEHIPAKLELCGKNRYSLKGIPVGGPYTVFVDKMKFSDIYVGDVWLLGGQSNMEGIGLPTAEDIAFKGDPEVRAMYMTDTWDTARHPLHVVVEAVDRVHVDILGATGQRPTLKIVGPGLSFALEMKRLTGGVPQGLICCAHGGTSMEHWSPALKSEGGDKSLYGAMLRRFHACGAHVRGLFWYQGCSDAYEAAANIFTDTMKNFVSECRRDFGESLPVIQVQIGRVTDRLASGPDPHWWTVIREQQRVLDKEINNLRTVAAIGKSLDDPIHISGKSQAELGSEAAEAMYNLIYGTDGNGCLPPPELDKIHITTDTLSGETVIRLSYRNLHGALCSYGRPSGFSVIGDGTDSVQRIYKMRLKGNTAELFVSCPAPELAGMKLYYGYGTDPYCNITDGIGRSIPAMGAISLKEENNA